MNSTTLPSLPTPQQLDDLEATFGLFNIRLNATDVVSVRDTVAGLVQHPMLVALHGIGSGSASWLEIARIFNLKTRLLAWDAPGYGESSPLAKDKPKAGDYAQQLLRLLSSLSIDDFVLVGHSLGALTAAALTLRAIPGFVPKALVLISPAIGYGSASRRERGEQVRAQRLAGITSPGIAATAAARHTHLLSSQASATAQSWVHWNMARLQPQGYAQAVELLCDDDLLAYCEQIQALRQQPGSPLTDLPVHVWCGEEDRITPPQDCQQVADVFGVPLQLIPHAGHACYVEQADSVSTLLQQVLQQLRPTHSQGAAID
ncbi:alpha/beta hydrolase [Lampropedia puyangensis]|uniref:Alpha/beta hydrolase n=1 Tax=Lampropedia puyangensis TaxID=1330072 RepID=A0A4S8EUR6_9BURK|nr:alpha/beta hydrolase [Lampropedia puyangensis]THT96161.1 alpha/beta hydrolase [Lampropedia puyangensis]